MKIEPNVLSYLNYRQSEEKRKIDEFFAALRSVFERCESPLEQIFLHRIIKAHPSSVYYDEQNRPFLVCHSWDVREFPEFDLRIFPQYLIPRAPNYPSQDKRNAYRADFYLN